jgi:hypothetical protein
MPTLLANAGDVPFLLTEAQLADYERDGFLRLKALLSPEIVLALRSEIAHVTAHPPAGLLLSHEAGGKTDPSAGPEPLRKVRNIGRFSKMIFSICTSGPLTLAAKDILGAPVGFYGDQVLFKPAIEGSAKPLHQDSAYFRIKPPESVITFWCSLNDADVSNGCMHYIPGSQRQGVARHQQLRDSPHLVAEPAIGTLVAVPTREGDCLVHNSVTFHMTPPNTSIRPRLALLVHYVRLDAEFPPRSAQATPIVPLS